MGTVAALNVAPRLSDRLYGFGSRRVVVFRELSLAAGSSVWGTPVGMYGRDILLLRTARDFLDALPIARPR